MVAKMISYYGKHSPIMARVGAKQTVDYTHCQGERRTGLLVTRGLLAGERGTRTSCTLSRLLALNHTYSLSAGSMARQMQPGTLTAGRIWDICSG
jgi:hypothetical protein